MEIEKIKITDITPAEYNPRKITNEEKTKLRNSLNTFGVVDPIIINLKKHAHNRRTPKIRYTPRHVHGE